MKLELTEQQRQALQERRAEPVEVVDPVTSQAYVLIARDQYERTQALLHQGPAPRETSHAACAPPPAEPTPLRQRLKDLPTPPEVAEYARQKGKQLGLFWKRQKQDLEDELKLQFYYGGEYVAYLRTKEGKVIVAAGRRDSDAFDAQLAFLSPEERRSVTLWLPSRWNETDTIL